MVRRQTYRAWVMVAGLVLLGGGMATSLSGCSSMYYGMMETLGTPKRDILVDRVKEGRDDQEKAKTQFLDALTRFRQVVNVPPSDLEKTYDQLKADLANCENRAQAVKDKIASIKDVGAALFSEWNNELGQYTSPALRQASQTKLQQTQARFDQLVTAMQRAADKMEPVLANFRDQVLFLKHNLNAQAVAALGGTVADMERDVQTLIQDMEASIAQANAFIDAMEKQQGS